MKMVLKCPITRDHTTTQVEKVKIIFRKKSEQEFREI